MMENFNHFETKTELYLETGNRAVTNVGVKIANTKEYLIEPWKSYIVLKE